jgi:hypothetical protein
MIQDLYDQEMYRGVIETVRINENKETSKDYTNLKYRDVACDRVLRDQLAHLSNPDDSIPENFTIFERLPTYAAAIPGENSWVSEILDEQQPISLDEAFPSNANAIKDLTNISYKNFEIPTDQPFNSVCTTLHSKKYVKSCIDARTVPSIVYVRHKYMSHLIISW